MRSTFRCRYNILQDRLPHPADAPYRLQVHDGSAGRALLQDRRKGGCLPTAAALSDELKRRQNDEGHVVGLYRPRWVATHGERRLTVAPAPAGPRLLAGKPGPRAARDIACGERSRIDAHAPSGRLSAYTRCRCITPSYSVGLSNRAPAAARQPCGAAPRAPIRIECCSYVDGYCGQDGCERGQRQLQHTYRRDSRKSASRSRATAYAQLRPPEVPRRRPERS